MAWGWIHRHLISSRHVRGFQKELGLFAVCTFHSSVLRGIRCCCVCSTQDKSRRRQPDTAPLGALSHLQQLAALQRPRHVLAPYSLNDVLTVEGAPLSPQLSQVSVITSLSHPYSSSSVPMKYLSCSQTPSQPPRGHAAPASYELC